MRLAGHYGGEAKPGSESGIATATVLLAHGAGGFSGHPHMVQIALALQNAGLQPKAFDFPYRRAGRKLPDRMPVLVDDARSQIRNLRADAGPVFLAGHSMGGRVFVETLAATSVDSEVTLASIDFRGLILFSYPLRSAASGKWRDAPLRHLNLPVLSFAGDRDPLCPQAEMNALWPTLSASWTQVWLPGADHGLAIRKRDAKAKNPWPIIHEALVGFVNQGHSAKTRLPAR